VAAEGGIPQFAGLEIKGLDAFDVNPNGTMIAYSTLIPTGRRHEIWRLDLTLGPGR
jgi:hypothetical protein